MAPPKATPAVLEGFYNVRQAAVRLSLADPTDPDDESGQRWLRDGCNRPEDGSKGERFPHHRMNRRLMFSDSDLAEIAAMHRSSSPRRIGRAHSTTARKAGAAPRKTAARKPAPARAAA